MDGQDAAITGQTSQIQLFEVKIARLDHHWSTGGVTDQNMLAPSILNLLGEAGLYLVLGLVTSWWDHKTACWRHASC